MMDFASKFTRFPSAADPRIPVAMMLLIYVALGITVLGFNRSPMQVLIIVGSACAFDMLFAWLIKRERLFPLSGLITGLGLSILVNTAHGLWLPMIPVVCAIASKYLLTVNNRHIYNPTLFGLVVGIVASNGMISPSPAYQWGGYTAVAAFIVTGALSLFVFRINRSALIISFLCFYGVNLALRAWLTRWHVPPETIVFGTITSPAFYLFVFFMLTDPVTSPSSRRGQIFMGFFIAALDLYLHKFEMVSTLFKAAFVYFTLIGVINLIVSTRANNVLALLVGKLRALVVVGAVVIPVIGAHAFFRSYLAEGQANFRFVEIPPEQTGITSPAGDVFKLVDSRVQHISKWLLSVGDAVAVADVNNDGFQDIFLTYPLKSSGSRAALYLNKGDFQFVRHPIPVLDDYTQDPVKYGLPSGGVWLDYDNDGDADLLLLTGYGETKFLQNQLTETGELAFIDVSDKLGMDRHTISLAANAIDVNRDGKLDLFITNALPTRLADYDPAPLFSIFDLPEPAFEGDRRMLNFMHRGWHNASNGGGNHLFLSKGEDFEMIDAQAWGLTGSRWTLDVGTGDFNGDGWTDMYLANDFGPDQMLINDGGKRFYEIKGAFSGGLGRDTYKGMNATVADIDGNGHLDIYVSNVHQPLQAEGSLLWMNNGRADELGGGAFRDRASAKNALNENRFGWGAAVGDLNRNGKLDIVQANGMVDDAYDKQYDDCPDYWYWNDRIALTPPSTHGYADNWADLRGRCIFPNELNRVYLNNGAYFVDVAEQVGWGSGGASRGVALVDLDNDGALDAVVTRPFAPASVYRNVINTVSATTNWLGLKMVGNGDECNRDAVGTTLRLTYRHAGKDVVQVRELNASNGFSAQGDSRVIFGLGDYEGDVTLSVQWCGDVPQSTEVISELNKYHRLEQNDGSS